MITSPLANFTRRDSKFESRTVKNSNDAKRVVKFLTLLIEFVLHLSILEMILVDSMQLLYLDQKKCCLIKC